jgi:hypothetical protein
MISERTAWADKDFTRTGLKKRIRPAATALL